MHHPDFTMTEAQQALVRDYSARLTAAIDAGAFNWRRLATLRGNLNRQARRNDRRAFDVFWIEWAAGFDAELASADRWTARPAESYVPAVAA